MNQFLLPAREKCIDIIDFSFQTPRTSSFIISIYKLINQQEFLSTFIHFILYKSLMCIKRAPND